MAKNKRCKGCKVTNFVEVKSICLKSKVNILDFVSDGLNLSSQKLDINADGEVLIKERFSLGISEGKIKGKAKKTHIKKSKAKKIMEALDLLAKANPKMPKDKKSYRWNLEINYADGSKRFARVLFDDKVTKKEAELSKLIRSVLSMDNLLLFAYKGKREKVDKIELEHFVLSKK